MSTLSVLSSRARTLVASLVTALLVVGGLSLAPTAAVAAVGDISGGTLTWGTSSYLNSGTPGRPGPLASGYGLPSTFDATTRLSTWGAATGTIAADGSATLAFDGTSLNFAPTGGGWLKLTDAEVVLDAAGNGTLSALVAYGTSVTGVPGALTYDPAQAPTRPAARVDVMTLSGNAVPVTRTGTAATWSGLTGSWNAAFTTFLGGDATVTPAIPAWTYATTISSAAGRTPLPVSIALNLVAAPTYTPSSYDLGTATWGLSTYLNSANPGRPNPLATAYGTPAAFDATTRLSSWGAGSGTVAADGSATISYTGTSVNFASTGGGWLKLTDPRATLDAKGNGSVTALVSYGTSVTGTPGAFTFDPNQAPTRAAQRVTVVTLAGNTAYPTQGADTIAWAGLAGSWSPEFTAFLSGDGAGIPAWTYATTISAAAGRTPLPFAFALAIEPPPTFTPASYDLGSASWGLSTYLNSANPGRPNPLAGSYVAPATFDATTRISTWDDGTGSIATNGDATISYKGTSVNFASTGGGWLRLTDPQATLNADGNGVVTALVSYGTSTTGTPGNFTYDSAQAPTRPAQRVAVVTLSGNDIQPVQGAAAISWTGLQGSWATAFTAFLAGDATVTPAIPAWTYATTISAVAGRTPLPFDFELGIAPAVTPTIALATSPTGGVILGANVTLTAQLSPNAPGIVTFRNGSTVLGTAPVGVSGAASLALTAPAVGDYTFTASFAPTDPSDFTAATSAPVSFSVDRPVVSKPGSLTWGVKSSLRSYVLGGGSISTTGGAGTSGGTFVFPQSGNSFSHAAQTGSANYSGRVTFAYPAHQFSIGISNPRVAITSASSGLLIADVTFNGSTSSGVTFANLSFGAANHKTVGTTTTFSNVSATLTAAGAATFAGFYNAGQSMDPVSFVIGAASSGFAGSSQTSEEEEWVAPETPPSTTGIESDTTDYEVGGIFSGSASGFQPNEEGIRVVVYSSPIVLEENLIADAAGVARWTGRLPAGLEGEHVVTFQGSVSRGIPITITAPEVTTLEGCDVQDAAITWGFKESFRSYISGTIANGEWTVADGATYETPNFGFDSGSGIYNSGSGAGLVAFDGSIRFTGHDGLLDTTVSNPQLTFVDADTAILLLDISGETQDGASVDQQGVEFVTIDLAGATVTDEDGVVTITDAPTELTSAGSDAFGTYDAGEPFDALSVTFSTADDCAVAAPVDTPAPVAPAEDDAPNLAWLLWLIVALVLIAAVIVLIIVRRRRTA